MATNLDIDVELLEEARRLAKLSTQEETVNLALEEFVRYRRQLEIIELFGTMDMDPDYDYKKSRRR